MKLVVFHYHLNRGGVSRVIENHLRSLATLEANCRPSKVMVAFGGRATDWNFQLGDQLPFDLEFAEIPALDYDAANSVEQGHLLPALLETLAEHGCESGSTVLHAHNHSLGKNAEYPEALMRLAEIGWRILLQPHDFAEDLRPQNYAHMLKASGGTGALHAKLYPQAKHIHYATLNVRDFQMLADAGVPSDRLHRLPNPVVSVGDAHGFDEDKAFRDAARQKLASTCGVAVEDSYVLYPVRGIQRKNLGELLLWASLCSEATFAVTLPPLNPKELKYYEAWKELASDLSLRVLFEVGEKLTLAENYAAADAIITTSVAEGFGLVFLEAALMGRPLVGRNLPGITDDFVAVGIRFPGLVSSIEIPLSCLDVGRLKQTFVEQTRRLRDAYQLASISEGELAAIVESMLGEATFDFGRLDSVAQRHVVRCVREQPDLRKTIRKLNPVIAQTAESLSSTDDGEVITANQKLIQQHYSLATIGGKLEGIYRSLIECETSPVESRPVIAANVQQAFLRLDQMYPLRLEV